MNTRNRINITMFNVQASLPTQVDDEMYLNIQLCLAHANHHAGHFRMSRLPNMN